jgi:hypothetical protein
MTLFICVLRRYEPHPLLLKYPSARVSFPECAGNVVDSWALDPMDSGINCTTPSKYEAA